MADNLTLGRGELWFDRFDDVAVRGERYLGNTPEFNLSVEIDTLEHYSSDRGFKDKDESVTRSMNFNASITTDNVDRVNLAYFFAGKERNMTLGAVTSGTDTLRRVVKGLTYQIGTSDANPSGTRKLTSVSITEGVTPLVLGTDYTIDMEMGRVTLLSSGSLVTSGDELTVTYSAPAQTRKQVVSGREPVSGALRFIAMNPIGDKNDYFMPYVKLSANGDLSLKGDEWLQVTFNVEVLRMTDREAIYLDGRPL